MHKIETLSILKQYWSYHEIELTLEYHELGLRGSTVDFFLIVNTTDYMICSWLNPLRSHRYKGLTKLQTGLLIVQRLGTPDPCVVYESTLQPLKLFKCCVAAQRGNLILVSFSSKLLSRSSEDEKMKDLQLLFTEYLSCARRSARPFADFPHLSYTKALSYLHAYLRAENKPIS